MKSLAQYTLKAHAVSDVGGRKNNEDAYLVNEKLGLFIVADGMGGHEKGEVASWFTSENLEGIVFDLKQGARGETLDEITPHLKITGDDDLLAYTVMRINRRLYEENEREVEKMTAPDGGAGAEFETLRARKNRMGTTLISLLVRGGCAWLTHVGDSRAYRISNDSIERLTHDHTWIAEKIESGEITPEEAKVHEKRNMITRSVGFKKDVEADIEVLTICPPERFLLCSDGLSNIVDEKEMLQFGKMPDIRDACKQMVELAVDRGGKDNITAVLIDVLKPTEDESSSAGPDEFTDL